MSRFETASALGVALWVTPLAAFAQELDACPTFVGAQWGRRALTYAIESPREGLERYRPAFDAWSAVACSDLALEPVATNPDILVKQVVQDWAHGPWVIALTTHGFRGGRIDAAQIELNEQDFVFEDVGPVCEGPSLMDLGNVLTHEVGHAVGIAHTPDRRDFAPATMFPSAPPCEVDKRTLTDVDAQMLCLLHPRGAPSCVPGLEPSPAPPGPMPDRPEASDSLGSSAGGCRSGSGGDLGTGFLVLALLFIAIDGRHRLGQMDRC